MGAFATVIICAVGILVLYLFMQQKGGQTPPGPFGLPLLGYLPFMGSKPHLLLQKLAKIYGPIFSIRLGSQYLIILDDLSSVKKVFSQQVLAEKRLNDNSSINLWKNCILLLQFPWLIESFKPQVGKYLHRCKQHMTRDILKNFKTSERYSSFNDCSLPLAKMKNNSRLKIGLKGKQMDLVKILTPRKNRKRTEFKEGTLQTFFHTSWKMLHYLSVGSGIQFSENLRRLETFINSEVQKQERKWNIFQEFVKIFILLQSEADSLLITKEEFQDNFRRQDYINCKIRQTLIEWLLLAMATYKDVQEKIHEATQETRISWLPVKYPQLSRIHTIINKQRSSLIYVRTAILELLRWRPPFPLSVMGVTSTNIVLDGYFIPKDSLMIANTWSILHNYECWGDDADVYNPERFLKQKENSGEECLLSSFAGKRLLLNKSFIQADILTNFLAILHKFNVSLPDEKPADLEGELFMSLQPKEQELILTLKN